MSKSLGTHTIVELFDCSKRVLNDPDYLEKTLVHAAERAGATVIKSAFHKFSPHGVTGIVLVAESHLSLHTWPEYGYSAVDIFTCGDKIDNIIAVDLIKEKLQARSISIIELRRGILNIKGDLNYKPGHKI